MKEGTGGGGVLAFFSTDVRVLGPQSAQSVPSLGSTFCAKNGVSVGTSRSRIPAKLQYEPRVDTLQHDYDACAAKYGTLTRLVPTETALSPQNLEPSPERAGHGHRIRKAARTPV